MPFAESSAYSFSQAASVSLAPCLRLRIMALNGARVGRLDDGGNQPARADAVGAHMHRLVGTIGAGHKSLHRLGIFGAEIKDMPDLDAARRHPLVGRQRLVGGNVVLLRGRSVERSPLVDDRLQA